MKLTTTLPAPSWPQLHVPETARKDMDRRRAETTPGIVPPPACPPAALKDGCRNTAGSLQSRENHRAKNKLLRRRASGVPARPKCGHQSQSRPPVFHAIYL